MRGTAIGMHVLLGATLACAACGQVRPEAVPYRFGQPLLPAWAGRTEARATAPPAAPPASRPVRAVGRPPRRAPAEPWRAVVAQRGRELVGKPFSGDEPAATEALLAAVFGEGRAWRLPALVPRRAAARPGDLVLFFARRPAPAKVGVLLACDGPRLVFLHLRGGKAQLGWLHLGQPHRRRLPGQTAVANSYVRIKRPEDPPSTRYLAGQLLAGFAAPPPRAVSAPAAVADARPARRYGAR
jgi:hypothetical protein